MRAEGRKNIQTAVVPREIPVSTAAEVIHKRLIVALRDNAHFVDPRIHHIGKGKIDQAISAAERNGSDRAFYRKLRNVSVMYI